MDDALKDQLALRAYELWEQAGRPDGQDQHFWFAAVADLLADDPPAAKAA